MKKHWLTLALAGITMLSFLIRVLPNWNTVFTASGVRFIDFDSLYYERLIEVDLANFPRFLTFDYFAAPGGAQVFYTPLLPFMAIITGYLVRFGKPDIEMVKTVAVLIPPVLGALITIPVYFIGRLAFTSRYAGIIGAILVAIIPSEFYGRTMLGYVDHHVLEAFFMALTIMFLLLMLENNGLKWALWAGLSLGLYHLSWRYSWVFTLVLMGWTFIQFLYVYHQGKNKRIIIQMLLVFSLSEIIFTPYLAVTGNKLEYLTILEGSILMSLAMLIVVRYIRDKRLFAITLVLTAIAATAVVIYYISQNWGLVTFAEIQEAAPLTVYTAIGYYGFSLPVAVISLIALYRREPGSLFLFWASAVISLNVLQVRFGYYAVIPIAVLTGHAFEWLSGLFKKSKTVVLAYLSFFLIFSFQGTTVAAFNPITKDSTGGWLEACTWLKDNTSAPYGDEDAYYNVSRFEKDGYAVLSWWDYGHYILDYGHRIPVVSNTNFDRTRSVAQFFTAQNDEYAEKAVAGLGVRYVMIGPDMVSGDERFDNRFPVMVWYANGSYDGWRDLLPGSVAKRLYVEGGNAYWQLVHDNNGIKIFERD